MDSTVTFSTNPMQSVEKSFQLTRTNRDLLVKPEYDGQVANVPEIEQHVQAGGQNPRVEPSAAQTKGVGGQKGRHGLDLNVFKNKKAWLGAQGDTTETGGRGTSTVGAKQNIWELARVQKDDGFSDLKTCYEFVDRAVSLAERESVANIPEDEKIHRLVLDLSNHFSISAGVIKELSVLKHEQSNFDRKLDAVKKAER